MKNKPNWKAAFLGKCPICGSGGIFIGTIKLTHKCKGCNAALDKYETADGPAFFAITIVGTLVGMEAALTEVFVKPPFWLHLALWLPAIFLGSFAIIRITKTLMVAHQYKLHGKYE